VTFEKCLSHLDACGLDATGVSSANYFLTAWQQGQMLAARVEVEAEHQGSIALLNSEEKSISLTYVVRRP
jgi:hypothetical protein